MTVLAHSVVSARPEGWGPLLPAWRALLAAADDDLRVFMSPEFLSSWLDVFGDASLRPHLVAFHAPSGECVGLAPWRLQSISVRFPLVCLSCIGSPWADYTDILALPAYRSQVVEAAAAYLDGLPGVHMLDLGPSCPGSLTQEVLARLARWRPHSSREDVCPWFHVEKPRASVNSQKLRRSRRRAAEIGPVTFSVAGTPAEAAQALEAFFDLHRRRWAPTPKPSRFLLPENRRFLQTLAARILPTGNLHLSVQRIGDRIAAVHMGFATSESLQWYMIAWDPDLRVCGPGRLLLGMLVEDCIQRGLKRLDLMRGAEDYKFDWADERATVRYWLAFRRTPHGSAARIYYDARTARYAGRTRRQPAARRPAQLPRALAATPGAPPVPARARLGRAHPEPGTRTP